MKTELPTNAGPYYWRAKDGDEWVIRTVTADDDGELCVLEGDIWLPIENKPTEQWLPIPPADELVEGIDAWAVFVEGMIRCHSIASTKEAVKDQLPFFESMHNKKCTVEAVTIYRKQES